MLRARGLGAYEGALTVAAWGVVAALAIVLEIALVARSLLVAYRTRRVARRLRERDGTTVAVEPRLVTERRTRGLRPTEPGTGRARTVGIVAVVAVATGAAAWLWPGGGSERSASAARLALGPDPSTVVPSSVPPLAVPASSVSVVVLNAGARSGAAGAVADRLRAAGFTVDAVGNAPAPSPSLVMWTRGRRADALAVAHNLGIGTISPVDGLDASQIGSASVVAIIGRGTAGR